MYPKRCAGCGRRGDWVCAGCDAAFIRFAPPWCLVCGVPVSFPCHCHSLPEGVSSIRSAGSFDGWLRGAITQCKYHGEWGRIEDLATMLAEVASDLRPIDALVPVPLHSSRLRHRGFNQSHLLTIHAAKILNVQVAPVLVRTRRTEAQVRLGAAQRLRNIQGAIQVLPGSLVLGKNLIVVDDVVTTGSTLAACAATLVRAGADTVHALTVAREM